MTANTWTCSVCAKGGSGAAPRCMTCNSIVCDSCMPKGRESCVNCEIEDGQRWFAPAVEEPLARLPRKVPLGLIVLVVLGPIMILLMAELMGRVRAERPPPAPVQFVGPKP